MKFMESSLLIRWGRALCTSGFLAALTHAQSLSIVTTHLPAATIGVSYSAALSATGGTMPYSWSIAMGALPAGLTLDPASGNITGTPTGSNSVPSSPAPQTLVYQVLDFQVQDAKGLTATANLPISVADPVVITTASIPSGTLGSPYFFCMAAQGGDLFYGGSWGIVSGNLPVGLGLATSLSCPGLAQYHNPAISGNPTQAGSFPVTLQASDFEGRVAQQSYVIVINPVGTAGPSLFLTPPSLSFTAVAGGVAPPLQTATVGLSSGTIGFSASVTQGAWLSVQPAASTTPATLTVAVNPAGLSPGPYSGKITIAAPGTANTPQYLGVTLTVANPTPAISSIMSAASLEAGAVAPGSIVTIKGTALGPNTGVSMQPDAKGNYGTMLAGSQVLFNGVAAPILYTQSGQINAIIPFEITGASNIAAQVIYNNLTSASSTVSMQQAAPALFTASSSGTGQGAILNQDSTVNSSANPAHPGTIVALFGTGGGLFQSSLGDGTTAGVTNLMLPVTAQVAGANAQVVYAGSAPGLVAGCFQINVTLPPGTVAGNVPVVVFVNSVPSQAAVTVAVR